MTRFYRGLIVAALHAGMVGSLGGKLLLDRTTRPRVWARVAPYDPNLPIRGRYVQLRVEGVAEGVQRVGDLTTVSLAALNGTLVFLPSTHGDRQYIRTRQVGSRVVAVLQQPLAFFISEHVPDPSIRPADEELWAELTIPRRGPPRPIRLGVKKNGTLTPLQ